MKKRSLSIGLLLCATVFLTFNYACKKNEKEDPVPVPEVPKPTAATLDSKVHQFNDDASQYKGESDQATDDINNSLKDISNFGRYHGPEVTTVSPMCGCTIDSSQKANKIIFFNFDGTTPCFTPSKTRGGQIKAQLTAGNRWSDQGAELTLTFINFKVTRLFDNKSVTINGVKKMTNINGNNWFLFITGAQNLKYRERAMNVNVAFDNGSTATWNSARTTEYNYNPSNQVITFKANGDTTLAGKTNVDSWGINRFNQTFSTQYSKPWVSNSYCDFGRPISGEFTHTVAAANFTFTLGVNQQGNPTTLQCAYGVKVSWTTTAGVQHYAILSY
jgi:hypothetical protein